MKKAIKPHEILVAAMLTSGIAGLSLPMLMKASALRQYALTEPTATEKSLIDATKEQPLIPNQTQVDRKIASLPNGKRDTQVVSAMAMYLEKKPGTVIAAMGSSPEIQKAWDGYLDESGYRAFDTEIKGALGSTASDESIRRLLVLNRLGMSQALNDMRFVDHSYESLLKSPEQTLSAVKGAFSSLANDQYPMEKNYLVHIAVRMAEKPESAAASQQLVVDELEKMPAETRTVFRQIYPDFFAKAEASGYRLSIPTSSDDGG